LVVYLIIFAALAAVVLFQLYSVLGRRVGRQPEDGPARETIRPLDTTPNPAPLEADGSLTGLAALRARDPAFDVARFLSGARAAYETVVKSFATGDRTTLRNLLSPAVMEGFETHMAQREAEGRSETVEFLQPPRADLEQLNVRGDTAEAEVRFLSEFRNRSKGPEGEAVDDRRTAEIWTFQRNLKSRDPNWTLIHVDAAEA
jgi:predicted lipid-binding transport protein (Tim44 family)